ncbi:MAG TPA: amino acid adenylation domain-containing protein, partial [Thermoanaerobaculia bacterium]
LAGAPLVLDLPTDRPRPAVQTSHGSREVVRVARAAELKALARREGLTPFMAVLAVYQMLLARHAGQETLIVGSPNANRNREEIEPVFGFFLTQLAFCTDLGGDPTLREALRRVRDVALGAYAHQELPFGKLVEALQPERDLSRAPIIQAVLLLLDGSVLDQKLADLDLEPVDVHDGNARYDVMFALWDQPDRIMGWYEYNADLWDATTVSRLLEGFGLLIETVLADPEMRLSEVPVLPEAARHQLLVEWNDTVVPAALPTALGLFAARAAERPEAAALVDRERIVTYGDLDRRADRLAARLRAAGAGPGARVGVCLERSADLVTALLAVWKTGAAYVPLDPAHPAERRDFVLADCGAAVLLSGSGEGEITALAPGCCRRGGPLPESPAYAIYTSGSTGRPKGVEVPHAALSNLLRDLASRYSSGPDAVWMAVTTIAFDIAALEIFLPLTTGARVVLADRETAADGELLARALETSGTTHLQATPAAWRQLLDSGWQGHPGLCRLCGGEALSADLAARLLALDGRSPLWNQYGPTETTIWSTVHRVEQGGPSTTPVPLGRPLANTRVHLLDRVLRPVPLGSTGELFLGGAGVARGYLGRPDLTAERFLPDPLSRDPGARLHRSGDLARRLADGVLEFLGRTDHQVKLRGFRIELGEIETSLRRHPAVADAVVLLRELRMGDGRLIAYLTLSAGDTAGDTAARPTPAELSAVLRERLPEYMLPSAFVILDALPLTPNGKVDRRALAEMGVADRAEIRAGGEPVAPRTSLEEQLVEAWAAVLGLDRKQIGVLDNFFDLGGHSLLATQLIGYLYDRWNLTVPMRLVFEARRLADLAERIAESELAGIDPELLEEMMTELEERAS